MDSEKCRVLLTVISEGTLSKAAEKLGYTVSGISRSISALEDECGFQLVHRDRNGVKLSSEGQILLPAFQEYAKVSDKLVESIHAIKGLYSGKVSVGVVYVNYFRWLTRIISDFREKYPEVEVNVVQGNSSELTNALLEHKLDFLIGSKREGPQAFIPLQTVSMCACVHSSHPMVESGVYPLKLFEIDNLIAPYSASETDYAIALRENQIQPNIVHVTSDVYSAYSMVEAGLGVSFLNRLEPECWDGDVVLLPTSPAVYVDIGIAYMNDCLGPSARELIKACQKL